MTASPVMIPAHPRPRPRPRLEPPSPARAPAPAPAPMGTWRVDLRADTREELFANLAMLIACASGRTNGTTGRWERVTLSAPDEVALLVAWANTLIDHGAERAMTFAEVRDLEIAPPAGPAHAGWRLDAEIRGRAVLEWHASLTAVSPRGARLERERGRWRTTLLFDI